MDNPRSNNNLNTTFADAQPARAAAVDSAVASPDSSSASSSGPLTQAAAVESIANRQASSHSTLVDDPAGSHASNPASAAHPLSGQKRAADSVPSSSAESRAAAGSSVSSVLSSSNDDSSGQRESQPENPRDESAQTSGSPPPAAVSAGDESLPAAPTISASPVSLSNSDHTHFNSAGSMRAVSSSSSGGASERKEQSPRTGSAASAVSAASHSSSRATQRLHAKTAWILIKRLFRSALYLVKKSISLTDSELQRYEEHRASWLAEGTALLEQVEEVLADSADEAPARILELQARRDYIVLQLASHPEFVASRRSAVVSLHAHALKSPPSGPGVLLVLSVLCTALLGLGMRTVTFAPSQAVRAFVTRTDAIFTQIASLLPLVKLPAEACAEWMRIAMRSGSLHLILAIAKQKRMQGGCNAGPDSTIPLGDCCRLFGEHAVSQLAHLRLFEYGLDPTVIGKRDGSSSALQMAREFVREHPATVVEAEGAAASAAAEVSSAPLSILGAWALQQIEPTEEEEQRRRKALHCQFMHALIPAWRAHSVMVLSLLSSPSVLIPDLAVIVGRYLDLEGLPVEPAESVDEDDAEDAESAE